MLATMKAAGCGKIASSSTSYSYHRHLQRYLIYVIVINRLCWVNKMRNIIKTILFISVFSPALICVGIVKLTQEIDCLFGLIYIIIGFIGAFSTFFIFSMVESKCENLTIKIKKIESIDILMLPVFSTYVLPFLVKTQDVSFLVIFCFSIFIIFLFWFMDSIPPHPLLKMLNFHFYKVESSDGVVYMLIAKRRIRNPASISRVKCLSDAMLVEG